MAESRIRITLEESGDPGAVVDAFEASAVFAAPWGQDHRLWLVQADGEEGGFVEAARTERRVDLALFIAESWRGRGVASAAVGRFLGLRAWPDAETLRATIDPGDAEAAAVLRSAGFSSGGHDAGLDVWERAAPRAKRPRTGPERFVDEDGRIDRWPVQSEDRIELLRWVADRALLPGEVLSERQINERLSAFTGDVALLRRHLVDHGLLERTRSGSEYALAPELWITPSTGGPADYRSPVTSRRFVALAALTLVTGLLAGCVGDPGPVETTPGFASEEEAFAAAEETYRAYVDALNQVDLSDPETFEPVFAWTTGELNATIGRPCQGCTRIGWHGFR